MKQRKMEKERRKQEEKRKAMAIWYYMIACLLALFGLVAFPSVGSVLFFLAAVAVLPIAPIRNLWSKIPIKGGWFKLVALIVAFFVACSCSSTSSTEEADSQVVSAEVEEDIIQGTESKKVDEIVAENNEKVDATKTIPQDEKSEEPTEQAQTEVKKEQMIEVSSKSNVQSDAVEQKQNTETKTDEKDSEEKVPVAEQFDLSTVPSYSGKAYATINHNVPYFTDSDLQKAAASYESYSNLDSMGRCGVCIASVGKDIMPTEERGPIGQIKPTGWQTVKYNGVVEGNYLYNRCHLLSYQLTGENTNEKNLITGTRYMNVEGMLPFENMVENYVETTGDHVLYRVTPVFEGNNLVASGVLMEAESVEDGGKGIMFNVYVYNVQPGVRIEYASGKSELDGTVTPSAAQTETKSENKSETQKQETSKPETPKQAETVQQPVPARAETPQQIPEETSYVLNTNTKKFHLPECSIVGDIKPKNREDFTGSRDDVIARGFVPCKKCNP